MQIGRGGGGRFIIQYLTKYRVTSSYAPNTSDSSYYEAKTEHQILGSTRSQTPRQYMPRLVELQRHTQAQPSVLGPYKFNVVPTNLYSIYHENVNKTDVERDEVNVGQKTPVQATPQSHSCTLEKTDTLNDPTHATLLSPKCPCSRGVMGPN